MAASTMDVFLASLTDEQIGQFFAFQHDADCDDKLMDVLTSPQYQLYLKTKEQNTPDDADSVTSWEQEHSVVSVTPSQAVSGTQSKQPKKLRIYVTVFSPVVQHLSRDAYKLKRNLKDEQNVDIHPQIHKNNDQHTSVRFEGSNKDSLLEAQSLMWEDLKKIKKRNLYITNDNIRAMWENSWERVDQFVFTNRTNVYPMFVGENTILYGFQDSHLANARELLEKYYTSGVLPSSDKNIQVKHDVGKTKKTYSKPSTYVPKIVPAQPLTKKEVTFTMYINAPVVSIIIENESLKNTIKDNLGVDMKCFSGVKDINTTVVQLRGTGYPVLIDVEYLIFEHISQHQQFTYRLRDNASLNMWKSWEKGTKVRFLLETTVFLKEESEVLVFTGFNAEQLTEAKDKLEYFKTTGRKPGQDKVQGSNESRKTMVNVTKSMDNLSMVSSGSSRTTLSNTLKMSKGAQDKFKFDLENGDEDRICGILIGKGGMNIKPLKDLYDTNVSIVKKPGCIFVHLTAPINEKIVDASYHMLRNIRQLQKCQSTYFLAPTHAWRTYSKMEKIEFQTRLEVTIDFDENNNTAIILKSFLENKLAIAISALENERKQNMAPLRHY